MKIYKSAEDYLEAILILKNKIQTVRAIDVAGELNFSKPSVSIALKKLRENGYITVEKNGNINLCEKGRIIAEDVLEKHTSISKWLQSIGVEKSVADRDACNIEHVISKESFEAIKKLKN